ncbi:M23 family metallopeptidase [Christiangramia salexigens]|uniref:Peptidase M23 n=1 Tax=Christiangramia salexigens TaxID=1913577 RepID=A0A1L3J673_9FLAO|nr:M23 family metallopeptidase [Christiangramia salexigens]APG60604.1 peptidase M23 [Christiangramia salexigens]
MRLRFILSFLILTISACSKVEKAANQLVKRSEKEIYQNERNISDEIFEIWESRIDKALKDSIQIEIPYNETGNFKPRNFAIYSYNTYLLPGEVLQVKIITDSSVTMVFPELYRFTKTENTYDKIKSGNPEKNQLQHEVVEKGLYKIIIQPEIEANTPFKILIDKNPAYIFPVASGKNSDIGSYWGDIRDGGARLHKGIDIFAEKGTPVIASTKGRIKFTGEKGLGGKQIWLKDNKRGNSLYYAHLDSIIPDIKKVEPGDTIGFVGNTGNAKFTPPHLHFGIYQNRNGAIDPLGYVYLNEESANEISERESALRLSVLTSKAKFRNKPASNNSKIIKTGKAGEILYVQGKTADWFHIRDSLDRSMYIHESEVKPAD